MDILNYSSHLFWRHISDSDKSITNLIETVCPEADLSASYKDICFIKENRTLMQSTKTFYTQYTINNAFTVLNMDSDIC